MHAKIVICFVGCLVWLINTGASQAGTKKFKKLIHEFGASSDILDLEFNNGGQFYLNFMDMRDKGDEAECEGNISALYAVGDYHSYIDGRRSDARLVFLRCHDGYISVHRASSVATAKKKIVEWNSKILKLAKAHSIKRDSSYKLRKEAIASFDGSAAKILNTPEVSDVLRGLQSLGNNGNSGNSTPRYKIIEDNTGASSQKHVVLQCRDGSRQNAYIESDGGWGTGFVDIGKHTFEQTAKKLCP